MTLHYIPSSLKPWSSSDRVEKWASFDENMVILQISLFFLVKGKILKQLQDTLFGEAVILSVQNLKSNPRIPKVLLL